MDSIQLSTQKKLNFKIFVLASFMFYVNDIFYLSLQDQYLNFIAFDYGTRIFSILVLMIAGYRYKNFSKESQIYFGKTLATFAILVMGIISFKSIGHINSPFETYQFPAYPSSVYRTIDLTLGLLLVAISEELLFRGYIINLLEKNIKNKVYILLLSCLSFSLIHWGAGVDSLIGTFLWGIAPSIYYLKTKNLLPCIIAHYITNLVIFY